MPPLLSALTRKARALATDPVLRRWLMARALGRAAKPPAFTAHVPPYLKGRLPLAAETPHTDLGTCAAPKPDAPLRLDLAGEAVTVMPDNPGAVFDHVFDDVEALLALHRFAWVDWLGADADPAWVVALWQAWWTRFSDPDGTFENAPWIWHPYCAAERAINILTFADRHGLPGDRDATLATLAAHGTAIAQRLEYFGGPGTGNHLANNGRGLYILGLALNMPTCRDLGRDILIREAQRLFGASGLLREGSSHYHALYALRYADLWARAETAGRVDDAALFEPVAARALGALDAITLAGGLPLVGDISPDIAPDLLAARLETTPTPAPVAPTARALHADGWLKMTNAPWSLLVHADPGGLAQNPGHGHLDTGGFELHHNDTAVLVDPGRGRYGNEGDAARYRNPALHNGLLIDGHGPFGENKPYYDATFRTAVASIPPALGTDENGAAILRHGGFHKLGTVGTTARRWHLDNGIVTINDHVKGCGRHRLARTLITPLDVTVDGSNVILQGDNINVRLQADPRTRIETVPVTCWRAYGQGRPGTLIRLIDDLDLGVNLSVRLVPAPAHDTAPASDAPAAMPAPGVSVVIPAYNAEHTIARALASVAAQTHPPLEVIVIDDGSRDATVEAAQAMGTDMGDIALRVLSQQNAGAGAARNRGIETATGDVIAFLDADDAWLPEKLARSLDVMTATGADLVAHDYLRADGGADVPVSCARNFNANDSFAAYVLKGYIATSTVLARRAVLITGGGFDPSLKSGQDYEFWLHLLATGARHHVFAGALTRYHVTPGSITSHVDRRRRASLRILWRHLDTLRGHHPGRFWGGILRGLIIHLQAASEHVARGEKLAAIRAVLSTPGSIIKTIACLWREKEERGTFLS